VNWKHLRVILLFDRFRTCLSGGLSRDVTSKTVK